MGFTRRRRLGVRIVVAVAFALLLAPSPADAGSLDACAQRVIRDWYSGGRVDGVYPLACYRAALRALPNDVLQYSNADQDIRRALAFARRGRTDPGNEPLPPGEAAPTRAAKEPEPDSSSGAKAPSAGPGSTPSVGPKPSPVANEAAAAAPRSDRVIADTTSSTSSVPYPIVMLAALSAVLLLAGAAGWLANRRR
jgi:cobalamin biosynthesis Mg chelatase CobN